MGNSSVKKQRIQFAENLEKEILDLNQEIKSGSIKTITEIPKRVLKKLTSDNLKHIRKEVIRIKSETESLNQFIDQCLTGKDLRKKTHGF